MLLTATLVLLTAAPTRPAPLSRLPLKTLVLYENGVGYFERSGAVPAGAVAEIPLEAGQLDDALKSLVVVSDRGVASVEFAPPLAKEAARAMAGLPGPEEPRSWLNLLRALSGVEVQVTKVDGAPVRGRVVELSEDEHLYDKEGHPLPDPMLMVFGEAGLSKVPLRQVASVRPLDPSVSKAWDRAAGSTAQQPERERLVVRGAKGAGTVAVGYTTEAPVWRTTYRLVMGKTARLQGFALVHNDSDEAWDGVTVSLASGRPTSFLFPLAGPRYGRRELVSPQDGLDAAPQLATREAREHLRGSLESGFGLSGSGVGGGGSGYGIGVGSIGTVGHGSGSGSVVSSTISSTVLADGPTPLEPAAVSEAGDLFLYRVKEAVHLGARKSALLPIIDGPSTAERVTVLDTGGRALTGVRLSNSTKLTLEAGTLSVFTDGAYAGETQLDRVKPGEVRVVTHGEDLDVEPTRRERREEGAPKKVAVSGVEGRRVVQVTRVDRLVHTVALTSRADVKRTVLVQLPTGRYRLVKGADEDVRSPEQPRYGRLTLEPRQEMSFELWDEGAVVENIAAEQLSSARVAELLSRTTVGEAKATLVSLKAELERSEGATAQAKKLDERIRELEADLGRLRENLAAVGKSGAATDTAKQLGERMLKLEDELTRARRDRETATKTAETIRRTLLAKR